MCAIRDEVYIWNALRGQIPQLYLPRALHRKILTKVDRAGRLKKKRWTGRTFLSSSVGYLGLSLACWGTEQSGYSELQCVIIWKRDICCLRRKNKNRIVGMESKEHYESLLKLWVISKTLPSPHCNIFLHINMWDEYCLSCRKMQKLPLVRHERLLF